jgi:ABC-type uncharacterized transport system fused permease/ATPase subunit
VDGTGQLVNAITQGDRQAFLTTTGLIALATLLGALANSLILYLGDYLCLVLFRSALTHHLTSLYMTNRVYYRYKGDPLVTTMHNKGSMSTINAGAGSVISSEVDQWCAKLNLVLFGAPMYVGYLGTLATLASFSNNLIRTSGWLPLLFALSFFLVSTCIAGALSTRASKVALTLNEVNAQFRFLHSHVSMHAEDIAFWNGGKREQLRLDTAFAQIMDSTRAYAVSSLLTYFFSLLFYWGNTVGSYVIPGVAYFWLSRSSSSSSSSSSSQPDATATMNAGKLVSESGVIYSLLSTLSTFILLAGEYSHLIAYTRSITDLLQVLNRLHSDSDCDGTCQQVVATTTQPAQSKRASAVQYVYMDNDDLNYSIIKASLVVESLSMRLPGRNTPSISDLSFHVSSTNNVVIVGASGIGKTSLLRVICGLWAGLGGTIRRPRAIGSGGIVFAPQRPYIPLSSLAAQLTYPDEDVVLRHAQIKALLQQVGLDHLLVHRQPLDEVRDWSQVLSPGEQQRIGIARILYHRPAVAVMDEATSAMDEFNESRIFAALKAHNIAFLSVAHRSSVFRYHHQKLRILESGQWSLEDVVERR